MERIGQKIDLIVNCIAMFFISPFIGTFVVCFFAVVFGTVLILIMALIYILIRIVFDVDLAALIRDYNSYFTYAACLYLFTGVIGGWIWGLIEIKEMIKEYKLKLS
jgi:hypothetical protein